MNKTRFYNVHHRDTVVLIKPLTEKYEGILTPFIKLKDCSKLLNILNIHNPSALTPIA